MSGGKRQEQADYLGHTFIGVSMEKPRQGDRVRSLGLSSLNNFDRLSVIEAGPSCLVHDQGRVILLPGIHRPKREGMALHWLLSQRHVPN